MYVLALAAIGNGADISIYTDLRTISGGGCGVSSCPWSGFSRALSSMVGAWLLLGLNYGHVCGQDHSELEDVSASHNIFTSKSFSNVLSCMNDAIRFDRLLNSEAYLRILSSKPNVWSELIFWIAQASALVHMTFGIFELSSPVFISILESMMVSARIALSMVLCQIVVKIGLAVMQFELQQRRTVANAWFYRADCHC